MSETVLNAWGEEIDPKSAIKDRFWVPEEEREDTDSGPFSDAMDDTTGDDLDGWVPGDPIPSHLQ